MFCGYHQWRISAALNEGRAPAPGTRRHVARCTDTSPDKPQTPRSRHLCECFGKARTDNSSRIQAWKSDKEMFLKKYDFLKKNREQWTAEILNDK